MLPSALAASFAATPRSTAGAGGKQPACNKGGLSFPEAMEAIIVVVFLLCRKKCIS
jgi:hypothetical protein